MSNKQQWLVRMLIGGVLGMAGYLLLSFLTQPGLLFGGSLDFAFTFCFNAQVPEGLGTALGLALWFAFGAEIAVATLPFADGGRELVVRSLLHVLALVATVGAWAWLNFGLVEVPFFLIPLFLIYLLIWLGRWVGWYVEVAAIRERLGLAPGPSVFKWKETLPYLPFLVLLCIVLPILLRAFDAADFPVLSGLLLPYILLPAGGFCSGLSLGRRQGFCPLYPALAFLLYLPVVFLLLNSSAIFHCFLVSGAALLGNGLGALLRRRRRNR